MSTKAINLFDRKLLAQAIVDAFRKLSPRQQFRNPVMFVVFVCSILTTGLWARCWPRWAAIPTGRPISTSL